jgi:hypothetical protein
MKNMMRLILIVGATLVASTAFAADIFLQIKDAKGSSRVVACPGGACVVSDLAPGDYTVSVCTADGKAPAADVAASHTIVSPRDAASGLPTGKRQHKPVRITKEWGAATPMLAIAIDEPGVQVTLKVTKTRSNIQNN